MPSLSLEPHTFTTVRYGRVKRGKWGIDLHADRAIDLYTVPIGELEAWKRHETTSGSSFWRRKSLNFETNAGPEFDSDWFLVIENVSDEPVDVAYDVFER